MSAPITDARRLLVAHNFRQPPQMNRLWMGVHHFKRLVGAEAARRMAAASRSLLPYENPHRRGDWISWNVRKHHASGHYDLGAVSRADAAALLAAAGADDPEAVLSGMERRERQSDRVGCLTVMRMSHLPPGADPSCPCCGGVDAHLPGCG